MFSIRPILFSKREKYYSSREGACANNAVQFQSCDGSSYCTVLGENGYTDLVSHQLRYSCSYQIWGNCLECSEIGEVPVLQNWLPHTLHQFWHHQGQLATTSIRWASVNCPHHHLTILLGPYTWHNWQWISAVNCFWVCRNLAVGRKQYQCSDFLQVLCNNYCHIRLKLHYVIPTYSLSTATWILYLYQFWHHQVWLATTTVLYPVSRT